MKKIYHTEEEKREAQHAYDRKRQQTEHRRAYDRKRNNTDERRAQRRASDAIKREVRLLEKQQRMPRPGEVKQASLFKVCPHCNPPVEKFLSEFSLSGNRPDGHYPICKECVSKWGRSEERKAADREYRKARRCDPILNKARQDNLNRWRREHPEGQQELTMRRNARKKAATTERVSYKRILARDGYWCHICQKPIDKNAKKRSLESLTYDHVIPIQPRPGDPQGTHCEANIKPAHKLCNARKGNKPLWALTDLDRSGP